jgi:hypothetical protein
MPQVTLSIVRRLTAMRPSRFVKAFAAGVFGACALTLAHAILRRFASRSARLNPANLSAGKASGDLREAAFFSDLITNAGYYSLVGIAGREMAIYVGAGLGLAAGLGTAALPEPLGVREGPPARTSANQAMTVALYTTGGLVAGSFYRALD